MERKKWDLVGLASIPLVMTLGNSMLIPVLPVIEKEIDITPFQSGLIISVYSFIAILLIPFAGYLSDRIGRKKVIIPSLIIAGVGGVVSAYAAWKLDSPYVMILIGRFLQGIGAAGAFPIVIPTVGDMYKDEKEVSAGLGFIETSNTFGKVLSPIIGAFLAYYVWFIPFAAIPVLCIIAIILVMVLVKAPPAKEDKKEYNFSSFKMSIKDVFHHNGRWLTSVFAIGCINMLVLFALLFHFSFLLGDRYHVDGVIMKGVYLAIPLLFLCITSYLTGKKVGENKVMMRWAIIVGNGLAALSLLFFGSNLNLVFLLIVLTIAGIGIGLSLPCLDALITEGVKKEVRGTVTSLYSSMRFLGVAVGPPLVSILVKNLPGMLNIGLAGFSLLAVLVTFFYVKPKNDIPLVGNRV
ncbi:MFS transporter [Virgibacillus oceani]|uniref:Multidrug resistance protein n=1 Tax=Virgibacillus oceani TaxID=1479511 RepID=A0A917M0X1_9BACI|nr:MFS transporter [Virgibacillus oceani]GGG72074.1 multidrug resistance protein [Virgibacillus oceani]